MPPKSLVVISEYLGGFSVVWAKKSPDDQSGQRGFQRCMLGEIRIASYKQLLSFILDIAQ